MFFRCRSNFSWKKRGVILCTSCANIKVALLCLAAPYFLNKPLGSLFRGLIKSRIASAVQLEISMYRFESAHGNGTEGKYRNGQILIATSSCYVSGLFSGTSTTISTNTIQIPCHPVLAGMTAVRHITLWCTAKKNVIESSHVLILPERVPFAFVVF